MTLTLGKARNLIKLTSAVLICLVFTSMFIAEPLYKSFTAQATPAVDISTESNLSIAKTDKPSIVKSVSTKSNVLSTSTLSCDNGSLPRKYLNRASSTHVKKLQKYEELCSSRPVSKLSFFTATPTSLAEADSYALYVTKKLKDFANYDITPLVFFEPSTSTGVIDLKSYSQGKYDSVVNHFFTQLKGNGITDSMMGTWVPVPEGNVPLWSTLNPNIYSASVTRTVKIQKKHFPKSKASLLLDSTTYRGNPDWGDGKSVSLSPYIKKIPPGLIDSFGLQGFPWASAANTKKRTNGTASNYLRSDIAIAAAKQLKVKEIWFNTGTFSKKYANVKGKQITVRGSNRSVLLKSTVTEAKKIQSQGFRASIHLFAENKSSTPEATDWSYLSTSKRPKNEHATVLKRFIRQTQDARIQLWLYDTNK